MNGNNLNLGVHAALQLAAKLFVERVSKRLQSSEYPGADVTGRGNIPIQDSIVIGTSQQTTAGVQIVITFGGPKAPYAIAYEYGSGIHSTIGPSHTYPIFPKEKMALAFDWPGHDPDIPPNSGKFVGMAKDGRFMFYYVDHPGIMPHPYIHPTITDTKDEIKKIIGKEFKASILIGIKTMEAQ